jgi:hypothetical protein
MKVYISKYRSHWISPYTILERIFFWTAWSKCNRSNDIVEDKDYIPHPKWVEKLVPVLSPVSMTVQWMLDKIHPRVEYVKIDRWDTWSMDTTLAQIILPMLKQLKATKHGVPGQFVHHVDKRTGKEISYGRAEREWNKTLDKMIWSFEQILDENNDEQFWSGEHAEGLAPWDDGWMGTRKLNTTALKKHEDKIQEGFELFGKYYRNLWD